MPLRINVYAYGCPRVGSSSFARPIPAVSSLSYAQWRRPRETFPFL